MKSELFPYILTKNKQNCHSKFNIVLVVADFFAYKFFQLKKSQTLKSWKGQQEVNMQ